MFIQDYPVSTWLSAGRLDRREEPDIVSSDTTRLIMIEQGSIWSTTILNNHFRQETCF